jgi:hypothetical protein
VLTSTDYFFEKLPFSKTAIAKMMTKGKAQRLIRK